MKSTIDSAKEMGGFEEFLAGIKPTANYVMAKTGDKHAIELCMAYAWIKSRAAMVAKAIDVEQNTDSIAES